MTAIRSFVRRRPLLCYYTLAFIISWSGALLVAGGPGGMPATPEQLSRQLPLGIMAMLAGPSIAGLLCTGLVHGSAGYRELVARTLKWRVSYGWHTVALLSAPVLMLAVLLPLSRLSRDYLPGIATTDRPAALLLMGLVYGAAAGLFEELGWTGFVLPLLRRRRSLLATGLFMGFLWGAWHYIVNFWGSGDENGHLSLARLLPALVWSLAILPVYRVLMVWVWDCTGSLGVAMLMHSSLTASMIILNPLASRVLVPFDLLFTGLLVVLAVAALRLASGPRAAGAGSTRIAAL